jgi:hypothetical protein
MTGVRKGWAGAFALAIGFVCAGGLAPAISADQSSAAPFAAAERAFVLADKCAKLTCRTQTRELQFKMSNGVASMQTERLPYVDGGAVILYPGERIEVDFPGIGKTLEPHFGKLVDHVDDPKVSEWKRVPTEPRLDSRANFWFDFQQTSTGMMLKLKSDAGYYVRYRAVMMVPEKDGLMTVDTSSCPVLPYSMAYESWPHPIAMIVLSDFQIVADNDSSCN